MKDMQLIYNYEREMEHEKWSEEIPFLNFPSDWQIQITPPFAGAVVRFIIKKGDATVSIYLDCYDSLGLVGAPYWEVYPHEGDVLRCLMPDTESLIEAITDSIKEQTI